MAKGGYIGVSSTARRIKKIYIGQDGKAKKVKKAYIGVNGVAKLFYAMGGMFFGVGGRSYPFDYDTASETFTTLSSYYALGQRSTVIQYVDGKWLWCSGGQDQKESMYFCAMDEKTHVITQTQIRDNFVGSGRPIGLVNDKDNAYLLICETNNSSRTYMVTINLSTYAFSLQELPISMQCYAYGWMYSRMVMLPNGKFLIHTGTGSAGKLYSYDKGTNTGTEVLSSFSGSLLDRAISPSKVWFLYNYYNLGVTDGTTVTYWNYSSGGLGVYNSAGSVYGKSTCVFTGSNGVWTSTDNGTTWSKKTGISPSQFYPKAITFGDDMFLALSSGGASPLTIYTSKDLLTWTSIGTITLDSIYQCNVAYSAIGGFER